MSSSFHQPSGVIAPKRVVVVGAGMLGLATAWFLQEYGVEVTVLERADVAAGSSWGNAGWLSPGMAIPLPEPTVLRYALRSLFNRDAALSVPLTRDPAVWRFLMDFARRSTNAQWRRAMQGYLSINRDALGAFDELSDGGVTATTISAPIMACFKEGAQAHELRYELERIDAAGQHVDVHELTGDEARALVGQIAEVVQVVVQINGQRYLDPGAYVQSLAASVMARGGELRTGFRVRTLRRGAGAITLEGEAGVAERADAVVVATGAWLNELAKPLGIRLRVQAGRGYSFSVDTAEPLTNPIYLPVARVACTPYQGGMRVGGTMEFRSLEHPIVQSRVDTLARSAQPLLRGVDWASMRDVWVGPRPVSADGKPLVGASGVPGIFVAGGHGMWGITLGPISGKLFAEQMITGTQPAALQAFSPSR